MKKLKYILVMALFFAVIVSCTDKSLDPLQFDVMKKGTILALRGTQLNNLYNLGIPGARLVPKLMTGTETFTFETEYLSADKTSLASVDVFVIKGSGTNTSRVLLTNVPGSNFVQDSKYPGPHATISLTIAQVLTALALPAASDPSYKISGATNPLFATYSGGVNFECDINKTDGTKVLAADIVAAGLFQSNQFYPAMKLTWTVLDYCAYDKTTWAGHWVATEIPNGYSCGIFCDDKQNLTVDATDASGNTFIMDNYFGDGVTAKISLSPSTNLDDQFVNVPAQTTTDPGTISKSQGSYDQCKSTMKFPCVYLTGGTTYKWVYAWAKG